jgi:hypothetical protein
MRGKRIGTATRINPSKPDTEMILWKPQFREFPFETQIFGRYARMERTLMNAIVES